MQARHFRLYSQEVVELGHGVSFLLLLPAADNVCSAPGQSNPYTPLSGFLHLPLQMFELGNKKTPTLNHISVTHLQTELRDPDHQNLSGPDSSSQLD